MPYLSRDTEGRTVAVRAKRKLEEKGIDSMLFWELAAINEYDDLATTKTLEKQAVMFDELSKN